MNNLAYVLEKQGDRAGARQLHEYVLSIRGRVLGEEHPDTKASLDALTAMSVADEQPTSSPQVRNDIRRPFEPIRAILGRLFGKM